LGINFAYLNDVVRRGFEPSKNFRLVFVGETNGQICTWSEKMLQIQRKIHFRVEEGSY
jgi:hypothetical protein